MSLLTKAVAVAVVSMAAPMLATGSPALAQPRAITIAIDGTIGAPPESRPRATWHLRVNGSEVKLFVTKLDVLAGATTDAEVLRHLRVNRAAILTSGDKAGIDAIENAPAGKPFRIQGTMRWAETPPILMVSTAGPRRGPL